MLAVATEVEHAVVPTAVFHAGQAALMREEVRKLNKAIKRKNRRIERLLKFERKATGLLGFHGVEWR